MDVNKWSQVCLLPLFHYLKEEMISSRYGSAVNYLINGKLKGGGQRIMTRSWNKNIYFNQQAVPLPTPSRSEDESSKIESAKDSLAIPPFDKERPLHQFHHPMGIGYTSSDSLDQSNGNVLVMIKIDGRVRWKVGVFASGRYNLS